MCIRGRFIVNRYDGRQYFVKCGHCDSCLQEKASRHKRRINLEARVDGVLPVFTTLTYDNDHIPYIKHSELKSFVDSKFTGVLNIYRDSSVIIAFTYKDFLLGERERSLFSLNVQKLPYLREKVGNKFITIKDKVGVLLLSDIQKFIKRLKINLVRDGYQGYFSYYYASEYGTTYQRPHFHVLFYIDPAYYSRFQFIVCKSWHYADLFKMQRYFDRKPIEIAKNPAKYVSSYLNCRSSLSEFLQYAKPFRPCSHFSNGFGCNMASFGLPNIVNKVQHGVITYTAKSFRNGVSSVSQVKIPDYVLDRYFPRFKGYRYLSSDEIIFFARRPSQVFFSKSLDNVLDYDERNKLYKSLLSLQKRVSKTGVSIDDWSLVYPSVHSLSSAYSIKQSYDYLDLPFEFEKNSFEHFNNVLDYYNGSYVHGLLDSLPLLDDAVVDPNHFHRVIVDDSRKSIEFFNSVKHHKIKNFYYEKSYF